MIAIPKIGDQYQRNTVQRFRGVQSAALPIGRLPDAYQMVRFPCVGKIYKVPILYPHEIMREVPDEVVQAGPNLLPKGRQ